MLSTSMKTTSDTVLTVFIPCKKDLWISISFAPLFQCRFCCRVVESFRSSCIGSHSHTNRITYTRMNHSRTQGEDCDREEPEKALPHLHPRILLLTIPRRCFCCVLLILLCCVCPWSVSNSATRTLQDPGTEFTDRQTQLHLCACFCCGL